MNGNVKKLVLLVWLSIVGILLVLLLIPGAAANPAIPVGIYRESPNNEQITANGDELEFQIHAKTDGIDQIVTRKYKYTVQSDGAIRIFASSNDSIFVSHIMNYEWSWSGNSITRTDRKAKTKSEYTPWPR